MMLNTVLKWLRNLTKSCTQITVLSDFKVNLMYYFKNLFDSLFLNI